MFPMIGVTIPMDLSKNCNSAKREIVPILAVIGTSGSGKTTLIECIVKNLTDRGLRVGTVKHVHHHGFTIDTEGKDTWRHSKAGARVVICVSPNEKVKIRHRLSPHDNDLGSALNSVREDNLDLLILEGFRSEVSGNERIQKIVVAKDEKSLQKVLENVKSPLLAISGPVANGTDLKLDKGVPLIDIPRNREQLIQRIFNAFML